jgi:hypothetical protein
VRSVPLSVVRYTGRTQQQHASSNTDKLCRVCVDAVINLSHGVANIFVNGVCDVLCSDGTCAELVENCALVNWLNLLKVTTSTHALITETLNAGVHVRGVTHVYFVGVTAATSPIMMQRPTGVLYEVYSKQLRLLQSLQRVRR